MATSHEIVVTVVNQPPTECPMCGFDSLRRTTIRNSATGSILSDQLTCGRCVNDLREAIE